MLFDGAPATHRRPSRINCQWRAIFLVQCLFEVEKSGSSSSVEAKLAASNHAINWHSCRFPGGVLI
jgi:hypothetical protein